MGTHKNDPLIRKIKKLFWPRFKLMSAKDAENYRRALEEIYRSRFSLEMHPLQTSHSVVPPAAIIGKVQGSNKSDPNTFLGSGYKDGARIIDELGAHGHDIAKMDRMLDFGVGTGRNLLPFLPFPIERHGCDVNPVAVEWTSKVLEEFATVRLSNPKPPLPYDGEFFDLVTAFSVFTHIHVDEQSGWVAELGRILKPGGCVIATVHDFSRMAPSNDKAGSYMNGVERGLHLNSYLTRPKLEQIWSVAFDVLEVRRFAKGQAHLIARRKAVL